MPEKKWPEHKKNCTAREKGRKSKKTKPLVPKGGDGAL